MRIVPAGSGTGVAAIPVADLAVAAAALAAAAPAPGVPVATAPDSRVPGSGVSVTSPPVDPLAGRPAGDGHRQVLDAWRRPALLPVGERVRQEALVVAPRVVGALV